MSYGEKAVGLTFNPSGDERVEKLKQLYAQIIDICNDERSNANSPFDAVAPKPNSEKVRLYSIAITQAQQAQMWAVKAITWKED